MRRAGDRRLFRAEQLGPKIISGLWQVFKNNVLTLHGSGTVSPDAVGDTIQAIDNNAIVLGNALDTVNANTTSLASLGTSVGANTTTLSALNSAVASQAVIVVFSPAASSYSPRGSMIYNPQMTTGKPYKTSRDQSGLHRYHSSPSGNKSDNQGTRCPRSVLRFNTERGLHPTQKPVSLMEYLIRTYSNEFDTVLDCCAGSFSTGIAAIKANRNFIGIEKDEGYFEAGKQRIMQYEKENSAA